MDLQLSMALNTTPGRLHAMETNYDVWLVHHQLRSIVLSSDIATVLRSALLRLSKPKNVSQLHYLYGKLRWAY